MWYCVHETKKKLEGARESAYLHQVNFDRCSFFEKFLRGHVRIVPGNMHVKFEVCSFNRFGAISIQCSKIWGLRDPGHATFTKNF